MRSYRHWYERAVLAGLALLIAAIPARAQLRSTVFVSGFTEPVAFVQDPANAAVQYVVEQGGLIKVVQNGTVLPTPFLNLASEIVAGGEQGLLGLAFPPTYGASGRFYVEFTNTSGNLVVARFTRSAGNPLVADVGSRLDLQWPNGNRFITHPFTNHNGGNLAFGPDGFLYIGTGDGGSGNDPDHRAQNPMELLGKFLRIDVNVSDADARGYTVPADNPFVGVSGYLGEIWSIGWRNPWRWSFDDPARGGNGALLVGDVGQSQREEIDYEPAGRKGRNYGWRNREGTVDNVTSRPPAFLPLTDPIYDYNRSQGQCVTGGYVYRGTALRATYRGRYFFADFCAGRVWSLGLSISGTGDATATDVIEHTAELGGTALGNVSAFGVDSTGELYVCLFNGSIRRLSMAAVAPNPIITVDQPAQRGVVAQPFVLTGWALDTSATTGTGISTLHVWAYPNPGSNAPPQFLGVPAFGDRPERRRRLRFAVHAIGLRHDRQWPCPRPVSVLDLRLGGVAKHVWHRQVAERHHRVRHTHVDRSAGEWIDGGTSVSSRGLGGRYVVRFRYGHRHDSRVGVSGVWRKPSLCWRAAPRWGAPRRWSVLRR